MQVKIESTKDAFVCGGVCATTSTNAHISSRSSTSTLCVILIYFDSLTLAENEHCSDQNFDFGFDRVVHNSRLLRHLANKSTTTMILEAQIIVLR